MAYPDILKDLTRCIELKQPERVACFPLGCDFDVRQTRYTHKQYRTSPECMLELQKKIITGFDYDWALLFPDDLIEWEYTGIEVTDDDWIPPGTKKYLDPSPSVLAQMRLPNPVKDGRMPLHLEGLRRIKSFFGGNVCVTGRVAAPFTAVSLILGVEQLLMLMIEDPPLLRKWMAWAEQCIEIWAQAQIEAGADALWVGDCIATSKFLSLEAVNEFAMEPAGHTAAYIRSKNAFSFYHGNETRISYLEAAARMVKPSAINVGEDADIREIKKHIGSRICIMGNLDPIHTLQNGTEKTVMEETKRVVHSAMQNGGYIFCTGEGIPHNTPAVNVKTCVETVKTEGQYK